MSCKLRLFLEDFSICMKIIIVFRVFNVFTTYYNFTIDRNCFNLFMLENLYAWCKFMNKLTKKCYVELKLIKVCISYI